MELYRFTEHLKMSSERLEAYEEELKELLKELQTTVSYQLPTKDGGKTTHLPWI